MNIHQLLLVVPTKEYNPSMNIHQLLQAVPTKENIHVRIFISYSWHFLQKKQYIYEYALFQLLLAGSTNENNTCTRMYIHQLLPTVPTKENNAYMNIHELLLAGSTNENNACMNIHQLLLAVPTRENNTCINIHQLLLAVPTRENNICMNIHQLLLAVPTKENDTCMNIHQLHLTVPTMYYRWVIIRVRALILRHVLSLELVNS